MDVAIIGAGPGGLALALGLQTVAPALKVKVCCGASNLLCNQYALPKRQHSRQHIPDNT